MIKEKYYLVINQLLSKILKETINSGNMSTLNAPEEVELTERLVALHPWADMARFARSGGEAMSIARRMARAKNKHSKIAFSGYHGWQDWYIAANLDDKKNLLNLSQYYLKILNLILIEYIFKIFESYIN